MVKRLPAIGRAIALLVIAALVAVATATMIAGIWLDPGGQHLLELTGWLAAGAMLALVIGVFMLWVVDRAADGGYATRLTISGVLTAFVFATTAWVPMRQLVDPANDHSLLWLILGFAMSIAALYAVLAGWLDAGPLRATAGAALGIAGGHYSTRLPETGNVEIAQIATATNLLASRAQSSAIRQSNQDRARESLLLAIAADAQVPIDHIRDIVASLSSSPGGDPLVTRRHLDALARETNHLQHRVDEVEEMAQLETGQVTLRLQPVSLAQLTIAVCDRLQPGAATRDVIISPRVDFAAPRVLVDPEQTLRALEALVSYALSETPDASQLAVEMREAGQFVQIATVELPGEHGPGVAERARWDSAHRRRASALSLAVAGRLIEIQGGSFLISRGSFTTPLVVVSLPRS